MATHNRISSTISEKRDAIIEQAIRTFSECGYRDTDVQVIADRAGVGKGTVYRYFRSKEDLFWATSLEVIQRMGQCVFEAMEGVDGACAKIRAAAVAHGQFFETNPHCLELTIQERAEFCGSGPESQREQHDILISRMGEVIQQGIESGELRPVDPRQTTLAMGCLLYGTAVLGGYLKSVAFGQLAEYAIDIFLQGIRSEPSSSTGTEKFSSQPNGRLTT